MRRRKKARGVSSPSEFYERLIVVIGWVIFAAFVSLVVWWLVGFVHSRFITIHRTYTEPLKEIPMLPWQEERMVAGMGVHSRTRCIDVPARMTAS